MLTISSHTQTSFATPQRIKIIAAGNAAIRILDRISLDNAVGLEGVAINTDPQSLTDSLIPHKIHLPCLPDGTFGTGGNPETTLAAIMEHRATLHTVFDNTDAILLLGALGGGTAGSVLIHLAQEAALRKIPALAVVTLPFSFEGTQKTLLATDELAQLRSHTGLAIAFPNNALSEISSPATSITSAFLACDSIIEKVLTILLEILPSNGPMAISIGQLLTYLSTPAAETLFTYATASGPNRTENLVQQALSSPLAKANLLQGQVQHLVVHISAGDDILLCEIQTIISELKMEEDVCIHIGITNTQSKSSEITLALFGSNRPFLPPPITIPITKESILQTSKSNPPFASPSTSKTPAPLTSAQESLKTAQENAGNSSEGILPGLSVPLTTPSATPPPAKSPKSKPIKPQQETLPFDEPTKWRFDQSNPTYEEGENIDIPTFQRLKIKIKI